MKLRLFAAVMLLMGAGCVTVTLPSYTPTTGQPSPSATAPATDSSVASATVVNGIVIDDATGDPVPNAVVVIAMNGDNAASKFTDKNVVTNGQGKFVKPINPKLGSKNEVYVVGGGHEPSAAQTVVTGQAPDLLTFRLKARALPAGSVANGGQLVRVKLTDIDDTYRATAGESHITLLLRDAKTKLPLSDLIGVEPETSIRGILTPRTAADGRWQLLSEPGARRFYFIWSPYEKVDAQPAPVLREHLYKGITYDIYQLTVPEAGHDYTATVDLNLVTPK